MVMAETDHPPALCPPSVTLFGLPPKNRIYQDKVERVTVLLDPLKSHDLVRQSHISWGYRGSGAEEA